MSDSLWPHGLQHARLPCPSIFPRVCSDFMSVDSVMLSNHLILCHPLLLPSVFPSIRVFSDDELIYNTVLISAMQQSDSVYTHMSFLWRRQWHPTPVLLPGKSHGRRSLVGCSPWGREESDMTERLHFSLSCIGEGSHRVGHDWSDLAVATAVLPLPYCLPLWFITGYWMQDPVLYSRPLLFFHSVYSGLHEMELSDCSSASFVQRQQHFHGGLWVVWPEGIRTRKNLTPPWKELGLGLASYSISQTSSPLRVWTVRDSAVKWVRAMRIKWKAAPLCPLGTTRRDLSTNVQISFEGSTVGTARRLMEIIQD